MATDHTRNRFSERLREGFEQAQTRLEGIEHEAQKALNELVKRGKVSRKELTALLEKVHADEILERAGMKEFPGRAKQVGEDVAKRLEEFRHRAVAFAGVASREQVVELGKDLDRLSRKLDKFITAQKAGREKS